MLFRINIGLFLLCASVWQCHAELVITREETKSGEATFPFRVGPTSASYEGGGIYFGAHLDAAGECKEYAISCLRADYHEAVGIMSEKATIGYEKDEVDNPGYDKAIRHLCLLEGNDFTMGDPCRPAFVTEEEPSIIYLLNRFSKRCSHLMKSVVLGDAYGVQADIVGIAPAHRLGGRMSGSLVGDRIFYATKPHQGEFGDPGTGIGQCIIHGIVAPSEKKAEEKEDNKKEPTYAEVKFAPIMPKAAAYRLDRFLPELACSQKPVAKMAYGDMYWDPMLNRLFVGLHITAGEGGARAVIVGHIKKYGFDDSSPHLVWSRIVPSDAFASGKRSIVGTADEGGQVSIHKVRTMHTSTAHHYLIVQGGTGAPADTKRVVHAVLLTSQNPQCDAHGTLAAKRAVHRDYFGPSGMYWGRYITKEPQDSTQMISEDDPATQVGCGPLKNGDISSIYIRGDVVFATVSQPAEGYQPGIFISRALFDGEGRVKGWSEWSRARTMVNKEGAIEPVQAVYPDPMTGNLLAVVPEDGKTNLKRSTWCEGAPDGTQAVHEQINKRLEVDNGVRFVSCFAKKAPGLTGVSLQIYGSGKQVVVLENGRMENGQFAPYSANDLKVVNLDKGALTQIGTLTSAEIVSSEKDSWLVVGGRRGMAVLAHGDGTGFASAKGSTFAEKVSSMEFSLIDTERRVKKLVADGSSLYVMNDYTLDRLDVAYGTPLDQKFVCLFEKTTRSVGSVSTPLFDLIVSQKLALLATGVGLLRSGNGSDVREARTTQEMRWTGIEAPGGSGPIKQLLPITRTGYAQDLSTGLGGHVYVLSAYSGGNSAHLFRYSVAPTDVESVSNETVQLFPDIFWEGKRSYTLRFGQFRDFIATDGWSFFSGRNRDVDGKTLFVAPKASWHQELRTGNRQAGVIGKEVPFGADPLTSSITNVVQSPASGNWVMAGDFGIRVNE